MSLFVETISMRFITILQFPFLASSFPSAIYCVYKIVYILQHENSNDLLGIVSRTYNFFISFLTPLQHIHEKRTVLIGVQYIGEVLKDRYHNLTLPLLGH